VPATCRQECWEGGWMPNFVYAAESLDGFIADGDGGLEWLSEVPNPGHSDYGFADFMASIDAVVMGRNTFETVLTFAEWPYDKPVFVLIEPRCVAQRTRREGRGRQRRSP
jgi:dihydrofolate reductase